MILYRQTVHDFILTNSSWFYTDKQFMILYRQTVHDFILTNSSWFYIDKHYSWKPEETDTLTDNTLADRHLNRQTPKQTALEPINLKTQTDTHLEDEHEPNKQNTRN